MGKHLSDRDVEHVVRLLDGWNKKLTWEALCAACKPTIGAKPARQTLGRIVRINDAFNATKIRLRTGQSELKAAPSMNIAMQRIAILKIENERLQRENSRLLEQFVIWQYNAHIRNLHHADLNRALPTIDRGNTED
jgi:hypothetical protein